MARSCDLAMRSRRRKSNRTPLRELAGLPLRSSRFSKTASISCCESCRFMFRYVLLPPGGGRAAASSYARRTSSCQIIEQAGLAYLRVRAERRFFLQLRLIQIQNRPRQIGVLLAAQRGPEVHIHLLGKIHGRGDAILPRSVEAELLIQIVAGLGQGRLGVLDALSVVGFERHAQLVDRRKYVVSRRNAWGILMIEDLLRGAIDSERTAQRI